MWHKVHLKFDYQITLPESSFGESLGLEMKKGAPKQLVAVLTPGLDPLEIQLHVRQLEA